MGQEVSESHFDHGAFRRFQQRLHEETRLISEWMADRHFSDRGWVAGLELELCLVDAAGQPIARNDEVIQAVDLPTVVPELSKFNLEFNVDPVSPRGEGIQTLANRVEETWAVCREKAGPLGVSVISIGILPTLTEDHLTLKNMTSLHRYRALNEQVLRLRRGRPTHLDISGSESLVCEHLDVMLEAGTTSLQLHLQVPQARAADAYNLATILSAPMVAVSANSPFLFGKQLWQETRVPLFEQAVAMDGPVNRVTFGTGYASGDLSFLFQENKDLFPVLLPLDCDQPKERLPHLRLQNGTIWRWNRPIVGFDSDGRPHLRIEHRVMAAGPSVADMTAQMALFYGLMVEYLNQERSNIHENLPFISAWTNFYDAARIGLKAHVLWLDGKKWSVQKLILDELLPTAQRGLSSLQVDSASIGRWLEIIAKRVATARTGSRWQSDFFNRSGHDSAALVREYRSRQESGEPVHEWSY
jgi:gamma-glutamyl:cysteine ligase YbdK (ATP-grasp superfamily)